MSCYYNPVIDLLLWICIGVAALIIALCITMIIKIDHELRESEREAEDIDKQIERLR